MKSKVYNGKNTLFWGDIWLEDSPLLDLTLKDISLEVLQNRGDVLERARRLGLGSPTRKASSPNSFENGNHDGNFRLWWGRWLLLRTLK